MRLLVIHNASILPDAHPEVDSERGILDTVEAVIGHLHEAGFETDRLELGHDMLPLSTAVRKQSPDAVFNLYEGMIDDPYSEARATLVLERLGVPFTGCTSQTLRLGRDKQRAKRIARRLGLDVPEGFVVDALPLTSVPERWPLIVKPALRDASEGIDQGAVVTNFQELEARLAWVLQEYGPPVIVEEFVDGREFQVGLIENPDLIVLPPSEFRYVDDGSGAWPIITFDAKWHPGTRDYLATPADYPAIIDPELAERLSDMGKRTFEALGCRDYARIDVRLRADGSPVLLELNPNPDLGPTACFAGALESAGLVYADFVVQLARSALARGKLSPCH